MDKATLWTIIGFAGQACFFSRILLQWLASEKERRSVVPRGFWHLSLAGVILVLAYAFYRNDPVFVLSMLPSAFIYIRNLILKRSTTRKRLVPFAVAMIFVVGWASMLQPYTETALWAAVGFTGSLVWASRFIVQWWISERKGVSTLPAAFWILSLAGNLLMLLYAIHRLDPVFIAGQSLGYLVYSRNLYFIIRDKKLS